MWRVVSPSPPLIFLQLLSAMMGKMPASLQKSYLHTALTHLGNSCVNCFSPHPTYSEGTSHWGWHDSEDHHSSSERSFLFGKWKWWWLFIRPTCDDEFVVGYLFTRNSTYSRVSPLTRTGWTASQWRPQVSSADWTEKKHVVFMYERELSLGQPLHWCHSNCLL